MFAEGVHCIACCLSGSISVVVQVRMTGGAGLMDMNGLPGGKSSELEDKQKEAEEADFSFNPDDLEK